MAETELRARCIAAADRAFLSQPDGASTADRVTAVVDAVLALSRPVVAWGGRYDAACCHPAEQPERDA